MFTRTDIIRKHLLRHAKNNEMLTDKRIQDSIRDTYGVSVSRTLIHAAIGPYKSRLDILSSDIRSLAGELINKCGDLKSALTVLRAIDSA